MNCKEKIIILDWSVFLNMSAYASRNIQIHPTYLAMTMVLGSLKKIGVEPCDEIIIACDHMSSWRKDFIAQAKADRKELREKSGINWTETYANFDNLLERLKESTNWHVVKIPHVECDDIMAVACRYYKDKEVILVTTDSDLEQCWHYENVKLYSPHAKTKSYKIRPKNFNIYKVIAKMVATKGHNNLDIPIENEEDYKLKEKCVSLITLPEWIEKAVTEELNKIVAKNDNIDKFPFHKLKERYGSLYNNKKDVITYEKCITKAERKKKRKQKVKK